MTTFTDLGVPAPIAAELRRSGMDEPFPIQLATIPDGIEGRDILGRAPTGSGKTLAFGIPVVAEVGRAEPGRPRALILAPTRELAEQIQRALTPLAATVDRRVLAVYGGVSMTRQRQALRSGVDVLVACPGRLADLIGQRAVSLAEVDIVVIDEADRMADMGFLPEVRRLLDQTSTERQTILFSATLDGDVATLTRNYQHDPVRHEVGPREPDVNAMDHHFVHTDREGRVDLTAAIVSQHQPAVVFTRTRHGADRVARQLDRAGISTAAIHGGRSQGQRDRALRSFSGGQVQALIATDVAARGIHVDGVASVIHFDPPEDHKTYLHRSGRTARAGATGAVFSLMTDAEEERQAKQVQRTLGISPRVSHREEVIARSGGSTSRPRPTTKGAATETPRPPREGSGPPRRTPRAEGNGEGEGNRPGGPGRRSRRGRNGARPGEGERTPAQRQPVASERGGTPAVRTATAKAYPSHVSHADRGGPQRPRPDSPRRGGAPGGGRRSGSPRPSRGR